MFVVEADNTTDVAMEFRQPARLHEDHYHANLDTFPKIFDFHDSWDPYIEDGPTFQRIGAIKLHSGRFITFPATAQRRLLPFELRDQSRPGRLSFVCLYLVDPYWRIVSTRNVPPQQRPAVNPDALIENVVHALSYRHRLPPELIIQITDDLVDWGPPDEEALRIKAQTDQERDLAMRDRIRLQEQEGVRFFYA